MFKNLKFYWKFKFEILEKNSILLKNLKNYIVGFTLGFFKWAQPGKTNWVFSNGPTLCEAWIKIDHESKDLKPIPWYHHIPVLKHWLWFGHIYIVPNFHFFLLLQSPASRFLCCIFTITSSSHDVLGLPRLLLWFGTQSMSLLANLSMFIRWTCPYHLRALAVTVSVKSVPILIRSLMSSFRTLSARVSWQHLLQNPISIAFSFFFWLLFNTQTSAP